MSHVMNRSSSGSIAGRRRFTALAALSIAAAVSLSACASGTTAQTTSGGSSAAAAPTVLTVYGWKGGEAEPANIAEINAAFEKANPDIKLDYQFIPAGDTYTQRVQSELLAGKSADVIMTDGSKVQDWGSVGYLQDLSASPWLPGVRKEVTPFISQGGKAYAVPMEVIGIDLFANLDLLKQVGVSTAPTTWDEFLTDLAALKAAGITPIALPNKDGWTGSAAINAIAATLVYQQNPDWDAQFLAGKASFTDWAPAVQQVLDLGTKGYVDLKSELGFDTWSTGLDDFKSGKSGFFVQGAWNQSAFTTAGVNDVFIPWPAGGAGTQPSANLFVGTMLSINAKSTVKDAAQKYVDFWADSTNSGPFLESESAVSPFSQGTTPSSPATADFVKAVDAGKYRILPSNTWFGGATGEKAMMEETQALWLGQVDVNGWAKALDAKLGGS